MEKTELEELKEKVPCAAVLEHFGFALDVKESTRKAVKYRRDAAIIIAIHEGKGWFDPLSDGKGDVFTLVQHLESVSFVEAMDAVADLVGFVPAEPVWERQSRSLEPVLSVAERWRLRRKPWRGSATWRYLRDTRELSERTIRAVISADALREGPHGSMWAAHSNADGAVIGWEERGPDWRGYASGGSKVLFRLGRNDASRLCVTEAAIDAMSLAELEDLRVDTLYLSTGGGWSQATDGALRAFALLPHVRLVAAADNNEQGETYSDRLAGLATGAGCGFERLRPEAEDWNAELKRKKQAKKEGRRLPHARRARQG